MPKTTGEHPDLVKHVQTVKSPSDVLGGFLSNLTARIAGIKQEDLELLANAFDQTDGGKFALKYHNPFIEAAIWELIEDKVRELVSAAVAAKKKEEEDKKKKKD